MYEQVYVVAVYMEYVWYVCVSTITCSNAVLYTHTYYPLIMYHFITLLVSPAQVFQDTLQALVDRSVVSVQYDSKSKSVLISEQKSEHVQFLVSLVYPFIAGVWVSQHRLYTLHFRKTCYQINLLSLYIHSLHGTIPVHPLNTWDNPCTSTHCMGQSLYIHSTHGTIPVHPLTA